MSNTSINETYIIESGGDEFINFSAETISAITITAVNFYGDGSNLTGVSKQDTYITGGTYSAGTAVFTNNTGGTFGVIGFYTGSTGFTGGTVSGNTIFTNGLSANTFSAATYYGLPLDIRITGGTYSAGTAEYTNNTGGTFSITGFSTGYTLTSNEIVDVLGYVPLSGFTDVYVTGGTYSAGTAEYTNNTGGTFSITGFTTAFTGGTVNGLTANTISATTYQNLPLDIYVSAITFNQSTYDLTLERNDGVSFNQNLGILSSDMTITGGTYNPATGVATFVNNSGGTFDVSGFLTGQTDSYTTGATLNGDVIQFNNNLFGDNFYSLDLTPVLSGKTNLNLFISHSGNTNNPHQTTFNNLLNTAHTHSITEIINLQSLLNNKFDISGGTVSGQTYFTNGLSANTFSAATYYGLPLDIRITGGTYSAGTAIFTNNTGGTFNIAGFTTAFTGGTVSGQTYFTSGLSANTFSAATYQNLPANFYTNNGSLISDRTVNIENYTLNFSSSTYNNNLVLNGGKIGVGISIPSSKLHVENSVSGPVVAEFRSAIFANNTSTDTIYPNSIGLYAKVLTSGGTAVYGESVNSNGFGGYFIGKGYFSENVGIGTTTPNYKLEINGNVGATIISATTYQNLPLDIRITGGTYSAGTAIFTNNTGGTFNITGFTTPFTGGTVNGNTIFTNGLSANTFSAATYQNLPADVNVITITTTGSVTTDTTSSGYTQHGRHVKISNGANAINVQCVSTSNSDFIASYEKIGTSTITFTAGSGITLTTLSGTAALSGVAGSKACLSRNGSIYYLQITNY